MVKLHTMLVNAADCASISADTLPPPGVADLLARGVLAGAGGGILGGLFGTSGPPFVAYLAYKLEEKEVLRASLIGMFAIDYTWRTTVFAFSGLLTTELLTFALYLTPVLVFGTVLGHRIHLRIPEAWFKKIVAGILMASGVLLLR